MADARMPLRQREGARHPAIAQIDQRQAWLHRSEVALHASRLGQRQDAAVGHRQHVGGDLQQFVRPDAAAAPRRQPLQRRGVVDTDAAFRLDDVRFGGVDTPARRVHDDMALVAILRILFGGGQQCAAAGIDVP